MLSPSTDLAVLVYTRAAFDTEERARKILDYLLNSPHFAPERFGEYDPLRRLTAKTLDKAVSLIINRIGQELDPERVRSDVFFERTRSPRCSYRVAWEHLPHVAFMRNWCDVEQDYVRQPERLSEWIEFSFGLLELQQAWYARFALGVEQYAKNVMSWWTQYPRARDPEKGVENEGGVGVELEKGIPGVYWGNYFGPFYVEWFGREKFKTLPCVEKRWLDTGGVFFTTASTPFDWDAPEARQLQQAVKEHLGADAFFDIETVRQVLAELEPIPEYMKPDQFQPPRRVPEFPFKVESPRHKSWEEESEDARRYFESQGFTFVGLGEGTLVFRDKKGGMTQVTLRSGGKVEYSPKL
jgi:hypothetical protein